MKIGFDVSPLHSGHNVRGVGFYVQHLKEAFETYFSQHEYVFFTQQEGLKSPVDIVHYPYFDPFFLTLPLTKKFPTVVTVHDLTPLVFPEHFPAGVRGMAKWQIQRRLLQKCEAVITDSHASQNDIEKITGIPSSRISVVYLAAAEEFKQIKDEGLKLLDLRRKYGFPEKFVLYVGDATWNKNLPRLIQAIQKMDIPLVLVGKALVASNVDAHNPWNKDVVWVREYIAHDKRFIPLGFLPFEDLVGLYNLATVAVVPSLYEGFGLPILEAMQSGCPVVTTREASLPEVAGEAALFVDAWDSDSLAAGIQQVYTDSKLQKELSQKGVEQAKKFSWQKTAEKTLQVYETVLAKK